MPPRQRPRAAAAAASAEQVNAAGWSRLWIAASLGRLDTVRTLLSSGAQVDLQVRPPCLLLA